MLPSPSLSSLHRSSSKGKSNSKSRGAWLSSFFSAWGCGGILAFWDSWDCSTLLSPSRSVALSFLADHSAAHCQVQANSSTWAFHTPHCYTQLFHEPAGLTAPCRTFRGEASRFGQICKVTGVNEEDQISTCLKVAAEDPSETYCKSEFLLFGKSLVLVARLSDITRTAWILGFGMLWAMFCGRLCGSGPFGFRILLADPRSF